MLGTKYSGSVCGLVSERSFECHLDCTVGWVNNIFDFSTFSYSGKLIYLQKSRNKQIFVDPCKNRWRKLNDTRIFLHCAVTKLYKIESQFLAVRFLFPSSLKHNFTVPHKSTVLSYSITLHKPYFYFFANVPKMPTKKNIYQICTIKVVLNF